jgi:hypothetical protein
VGFLHVGGFSKEHASYRTVVHPIVIR